MIDTPSETHEAALSDERLRAKPLTIVYTNWRGETAERRILPTGIWFGSTEWHPEPQWLVKAIDVEKNAERDFAWNGIDFQGDGPACATQPSAGEGWVYFNEDSGEEYSPNHPVESGECEDATDIRRSTPQEDHLWAALQEEFQRAEKATAATPPDQSKRVERLETALSESRQWLAIVADEYEKASGEPQHIADTIARIDQALHGDRS